MQQSLKIKKNTIIIVVMGVVLVLDQVTKAILTAKIEPLGSVEVVAGLFSIVNVANRGAAFGMFKGGGALVLILIAIAALILITYLLYTSRERLTVLSLSLIGAGALGNLIDRIRLSEVVDFLDFHLGAYHWPAFNVADIAISVGVLLYLVTIYRCGGSGEQEAD
ncbi:MAG: signal peptidase II [Proteobacteria bacterium]|nr:signal peptidase II [Pseudomonadota bacterium]